MSLKLMFGHIMLIYYTMQLKTVCKVANNISVGLVIPVYSHFDWLIEQYID